ncbi:MAG: sialate O-acetylesterase [Parvularcula sp.]|jgi:hypothetical protein|nr:sialate O-acetylesterase [Parvularcula sp.]
MRIGLGLGAAGRGRPRGGSGQAAALPPAQVTGLQVAAGDGSLSIFWDEPADRGSPITDYLIDIDDGAGWTRAPDAVSPNPSATITGLTNGAEYRIRVSAVNEGGVGAPSVAVAQTPIAPASRETHVFLLAGQSNSTDLGVWDGGADWPANAYQMQRWELPLQAQDQQDGARELAPNASPLIGASRPLHHHFRTPPNGFGFSLQFAIDYLAAHSGIDLVLIPAAHGGTGFAGNRWNPGDDLYMDAVARVNALMTAHPAFLFKGIIWHQGEADTSNVAEADAYEAALDAMFAAMRTDISAMTAQTPIVLGQMVESWVSGNVHREQVQAIINDTPRRIPYTAVVSSSGASAASNHFDAAGYRTMGARYAAAYSVAAANDGYILPVLTVPAQVTGVTLAPSDGEVLASWTAPDDGGSAITDYIVRLDGQVYADGIGVSTQSLITGLSNDVEVSVTVAAVNDVGEGLPSLAVSATPSAPNVGAEAGAIGHWLFGSDNPGHVGLVGGALTEAGSAVVQSASYITNALDGASGLTSALYDSADITLAGVFRANSSANAILMGAFGNGSVNPRMAIMRSSSAFGVRVNSFVGGAQNLNTSADFGGHWAFLAVSFDADGNRLVYFRKAGAAEIFTDTVPRGIVTGTPLHILDPGYGTGTFNDQPQDVAEWMILPGAKSPAELDGIYARSAARLNARGIILGD